MTVIINNVFLQSKIWINYSAQLFIHNLHSVYNVMIQFKTAPKKHLVNKAEVIIRGEVILSVNICTFNFEEEYQKKRSQIIEFYTLIIICMVSKVLFRGFKSIFPCSLLLTK